jgi:hypothetical protein
MDLAGNYYKNKLFLRSTILAKPFSLKIKKYEHFLYFL